MAIYRYLWPLILLLSIVAGRSMAATDNIIVLTQVPCQFIESENGTDHGYSSRSADDCVALNKSSAEARLAEARVIQLRPGRYAFRVTNKNVPYELGFWLRGAGVLGYATLPSVSGGGLVTGKTQDYVIELKAGEYIYSCPLNSTPDYRLIVK